MLGGAWRPANKHASHKHKSPRIMPEALRWLRFLKVSYLTLRKMMTRVKSERDSMNARPRTSSSWMPARAPGLRARASQAEAVARPWPRPQRPAAIAIPTPAPIGTMLIGWLVADCAYAGIAMNSADSVIEKY